MKVAVSVNRAGSSAHSAPSALKKKKPRCRSGNGASSKNSLAATYFSTLSSSIIGAAGLNFSVRNGKRCTPRAIATKKKVLTR
jgi:hypothetical protein